MEKHRNKIQQYTKRGVQRMKIKFKKEEEEEGNRAELSNSKESGKENEIAAL